MTEKKIKDYCYKRVRKIDDLISELFDECEDERAALIVIETVAYQATGLFAQAVEALPPKKRTSMKVEYMASISEILVKGLDVFLAEKKKKEETK